MSGSYEIELIVQWNKPDTNSHEDAQKDYDSRAQFYFAYSSLVLYSFGLENAIEVSD